ncbi:MAG: hypothetical protein DRH50_14915 [Deltaproteobacteria bacterium]|nr:MAG: hypothetical protein DRH50_14915 [Deltaproteobacteria bacterium]
MIIPARFKKIVENNRKKEYHVNNPPLGLWRDLHFKRAGANLFTALLNGKSLCHRGSFILIICSACQRNLKIYWLIRFIKSAY